MAAAGPAANPWPSPQGMQTGRARLDLTFSHLDEEERREDDYLALQNEALAQLPTFDRVRHVVLPVDPECEAYVREGGRYRTVYVKRLGKKELRRVLEMALGPAGDNLVLLTKIRDRLDRVGIVQPSVEVRFQDLTVDASVYTGNRAMPTLTNTLRNAFEAVLVNLRLRKSPKRNFTILQSVSGVLKPGRFTLLLGPPGAGKSTLLLALAGKLGGSLRIRGKRLYNGHGLSQFVAQRTAAYVSQVDTHIGELTVRETFDFAARCQGPGYLAGLLKDLSHKENERRILPDPEIDAFMKAAAAKGARHHIRTDYVLKLFGLAVCADTVVGNNMLRGISGGQKKRVTSGEMVVGGKRVIYMDEVSTGLDSSTTFQIVNVARNFAHLLEGTVLMALLQPAPETFELFDDVMLLSEGHLVYQGPRERVLEFFATLGFRCPPRKGVADFLQEVTSRKDQEQYWARDTPYAFVPVKAFEDAFWEWEEGQRIRAYLATPPERDSVHSPALVRTPYALSPPQMFCACGNRELILMSRNRFLYVFRTGQVVFVSLILSTLFFRTTLSPDSLQDGLLYLGALFFAIIHMMFNAFSELAMEVGRLPVFYKQRDNLFYAAWAFSFPVALIRIPYSFMESAIFTCICYYVIGFAPEASRFFTFWLILFAMHTMAVSLFRFIGTLGRKLVIANTFGSFALVFVFLLGGFIVAKPDIHPWVVWGYWISPLTYAQNAISINEFTAPRWDKPAPTNPSISLGDQVLQSRGLYTDTWWIWLGIGALFAFAFLFNFLTIMALAFMPPLGRPQAVVPEEVLAEKEVARLGERQDGEAVSTRDETVAGDVEMGRRGAAGQGDSGKYRREERSGGEAPGEAPLARPAAPVGARLAEPAALGDARLTREDTLHTESEGPMPNLKSEAVAKERNDAPVEPEDTIARAPVPSWKIASGGSRGAVKRGMILPFQPLAMTFHDLFYSVDPPSWMEDEGLKGRKLQLLKSVSGAFRPGVLTALMGVSGAGKTTLMDVLSGRKTGGYIEGNIRVAGFPKVQTTFARISGYVEQNDIHSPQTTVREALSFSAWLRLSRDVDAETREQFVDEVLDLVELTPLRKALVGLPGVSGLSVEQRKRLTIAVELVANPSIIFMDEPTSGLDARAAAIVMRAVRNTVDTGRTVVCTIHQPSIDIFESFDELLLLKAGGYVIYAGSLGRRSVHLVNYLQEFNGVPPIKEGVNPATWMLEVTTPAMEEQLQIDFADAYKNSDLFRRNEELSAELSKSAPGAKDLNFDSTYARSGFTQFAACLWRVNKIWWRSPDYNMIRYFFTLIVALIFGAVFWGFGSNRSTRGAIFNVMGALYAAVLFLGVSNSSTIQPVVAVERSVSYRERAAGMYGAWPLSLALGVIELPYVLVQSVIYSVITYSMIQFQWTSAKFLWYLLFMYLTLLYFAFYGMMAVALTPSIEMAAVISSTFYSIWNLFSGFIIPRLAMPGWWVWYWYICPVAWTLYGLIASQLGDVEEPFTDVDGTQSTGSAFIESYLGFKHSWLGICVAVLVGFDVTFWAVAAFSLKYLNYQRR